MPRRDLPRGGEEVPRHVLLIAPREVAFSLAIIFGDMRSSTGQIDAREVGPLAHVSPECMHHPPFSWQHSVLTSGSRSDHLSYLCSLGPHSLRQRLNLASQFLECASSTSPNLSKSRLVHVLKSRWRVRFSLSVDRDSHR